MTIFISLSDAVTMRNGIEKHKKNDQNLHFFSISYAICLWRALSPSVNVFGYDEQVYKPLLIQ
jgi:hypothetical protein